MRLKIRRLSGKKVRLSGNVKRFSVKIEKIIVLKLHLDL